jgi:hypothetical protein
MEWVINFFDVFSYVLFFSEETFLYLAWNINKNEWKNWLKKLLHWMTGNKLVMQICEYINWLFFDEVSIESFEVVKYPEMINFITLEKSYAFILFASENKSCSSKYYS